MKKQREELLGESPSQTAGPYVHIGCLPNFSGIAGLYDSDPGSVMLDDRTRGERIGIRGRIFDGEDELITDAVVEIWQADADGFYASPGDERNAADPHFHGWGRCACDFSSGEFRFDTIRPGRVPFADGRLQAPHITLWVVARGINIGLHTRVYFADENEANAEDPILAAVEPRGRVETLIAGVREKCEFQFDIRLQGPRETVFFDM